MTWRSLLYAAISLGVVSCTGASKLSLPSALDSSFRSGEVHMRLLRDKLEVLEYRLISATLIQAAYRDSTLTYGIIAPRSTLVAGAREYRWIFGTDSIQCNIHFLSAEIYRSSENSSLLLDILYPPQKRGAGYDRYQTTNAPYKRMATGTITHPSFPGEMHFQFEHGIADKMYDSSRVSGFLWIGPDSLVVQPYFKEMSRGGKNRKPQLILQGYALSKGDSLIAFLLHAPLVRTVYKPGLKDVLYLSRLSTPGQQIIAAAFSSVVSRLMVSIGNEALY